MPLLVPSKTIMGEWGSVEGPYLGVRSVSAFGTQITPGLNAYGSPVKVGSNLTVDAWAIWINVNGVAVSDVVKECVVQIGFDFSGGTTFPSSPDEFNSITLLASQASFYNVMGGGCSWYFPLRIPAGTAILARAAMGESTFPAAFVQWVAYGRPKYPEVVRRGSWVETLGTINVGAGTYGTPVTAGTTSEGVAVQLGTLARPAWYFEYGCGTNDATMTTDVLHVDVLRDSATGPHIIQDARWTTDVSEQSSKQPSLLQNPVVDCPAGTPIYGRMQNSGSNTSGYRMLVNAVGG